MRKLKFRIIIIFFTNIPQLLKEVSGLHTSPSRLNRLILHVPGVTWSQDRFVRAYHRAGAWAANSWQNRSFQSTVSPRLRSNPVLPSPLAGFPFIHLALQHSQQG